MLPKFKLLQFYITACVYNYSESSFHWVLHISNWSSPIVEAGEKRVIESYSNCIIEVYAVHIFDVCIREEGTYYVIHTPSLMIGAYSGTKS